MCVCGGGGGWGGGEKHILDNDYMYSSYVPKTYTLHFESGHWQHRHTFKCIRKD